MSTTPPEYQTPSAAQRLYDSLQSASDLNALIGEAEDLHLEVKECSAPLLENMKGYVSQVLSGFANSDGGILILGMTARRDPETGVDVVSGLQAFTGYVGVQNDILHLIHRATDPPVDGVEVRHVTSERDDTYGYVVMFVPATEGGPHRALLKRGGDREYWKRTGDSFFKMEHYDIADMMGRRRRPKLVFAWRPYILRTEPPLPDVRDRFHEVGIILTLRNLGRGLAMYPMLEIGLAAPLEPNPYGLDGNRNHGLRRQALPDTAHGLLRFIGEPAHVIHPGVDLDVTKLVGIRMHQGAAEWTFTPAEVRLDYRVAAEDQQVTRGSVTITSGELIDAMRPLLGFGS